MGSNLITSGLRSRKRPFSLKLELLPANFDLRPVHRRVDDAVQPQGPAPI